MLTHLKRTGFLICVLSVIAVAVMLVFASSPAAAETIKQTPSAVSPPKDFVGPPIPLELLASPPTPEAPAPAPAVQAEGETDDLVLQLIINDVEMEDVLQAKRREGKLYVALGQLSGILDFAIKIDPATKGAKGWFIREQNTMELTETTAEVKGKSAKFPPGSIFYSADDKDLYVDTELLHGWMPLDFTLDLHRMTLGITTREALPFQEKNLREKKHEALAQRQQGTHEQTFKKIDIPYEAAQWPTVDLTISPSYDSTNTGLRNDYSALAVGDFGYLTARLYASGDIPHDNLSDLRLSFGRDDYEKKLLGFAHASSFRFGDIDSVSLSQVATPTLGRGVTVTNRDLDRPDNFDVTNFIGDAKPGWEVELYQNGALISFQTVGEDGRYAFRNIPILFGNNQFRLAFYGPQGQVEEINKTVNAEASLLEKGQVSYNFSADEKNKTLFGVSDPTGATTPSGLSGVGEMEYGVTRTLTIAGGTAHTVLTDGDHNYATAGVRASLGNVLASADGAYDTTASTYSTRMSLSTDIKNTLLSVQQKFARDFHSEENDTLTQPVNRQTVARVDRQFGDLAASLAYTNSLYEGGRLEHLWTNQLTHPLFGMTFTNTLKYDYDNLGLDNLSGSAFMRGYVKKVLVGAQLDYEDKPVRQLDMLKLDGLYPFSPTMNDKVTLTSQLSGTKINTIENTATFDRERYKLSLTGRVNDQGDYFAGLTFNMSIGRVPNTGKWIFSGKTLAETGTVAVVPYLDHNYNMAQDTGEGPPPSSSIRIGSQTVKVDKNGTAIATQLTTNTPVSISIDPENQQANPFFTSGVDAYRVVPRPGKIITVPFPVFETSQVDGTVSGPPGVNLKDLGIELVNTDGQVVRTAHTAFDGYYLMEGVMPGAYKLRVSADMLAERHLRQDEDKSVTITVSDFFVRDIHLVDASSPASAPANEPPPAPQDAAVVPPSPVRDEEKQAKTEPPSVSAEGPPMPQVKPEEVQVAPLADGDAGLAAMAQPVVPVPAPVLAPAPLPEVDAGLAKMGQPVVPVVSPEARKSLVIVNEAAPPPPVSAKAPHFIIINEHPAAPQPAHKPSLIIVNDPY